MKKLLLFFIVMLVILGGIWFSLEEEGILTVNEDLIDGLSKEEDTFTLTLEFLSNDELKVAYDKYLSEVRTYSNQVQDLGTKGLEADNVTLKRSKGLYTASMFKSSIIAEKFDKEKLEDLRLPSTYFTQHLKSDMCNSDNFTDREADSYEEYVNLYDEVSTPVCLD